MVTDSSTVGYSNFDAKILHLHPQATAAPSHCPIASLHLCRKGLCSGKHVGTGMDSWLGSSWLLVAETFLIQKVY